MSQIYKINNFTWWLSWDDFLWREWSYLFAENIDARQNYNWIELVRALQVNWSTGSNTMNGFQEVFSWSSRWVFAYWEDWTFYNTTWLSLWATDATKDLLNWIAFWDYIYFAYRDWTDAKLSRITKADAISNINVENWFNWRVTDDAITWITWYANSSKYPLLNYVDEFMLFWVWPKLYRLAIWDSAVSNVFDNDLEADIVWLTESSWLFKIFLQNWKILFWDWQSQEFSAITNIHNTIQHIYWYWDTDYILAWYNSSYSELHILQGYQTQLLQRVIYSEREDKTIYAFWGNANTPKPQVMAKRLWLLWLWASWSATEWVYTYWTDVLWTNDTFQFQYSKDDSWETIWEVTAIYPFTSWLYISYRTSSWDKIWLIDLNVNPSNKKQDTWTWISRIFDWWDRTQIKQIQKIKVKTDNCSTSNYITIKLKRNWWSYETIWVCNDNQKNLYEYISPIWNFEDLQIKAEFVWSWTATPKLQEINITYDIVNV